MDYDNYISASGHSVCLNNAHEVNTVPEIIDMKRTTPDPQEGFQFHFSFTHHIIIFYNL